MDTKIILEDVIDYLAPRLDTYELAIYLYVFRNSRLKGTEEAVVGFRSARNRMAMGIGDHGKPMADRTCYEKLRSLEQKGCVRILGTERSGTRLRVFLPSEIEGLIPPEEIATEIGLEEMDLFDIPANRIAILRRECNHCFYCLRALDQSNYVIEHVLSRPNGTNGYRNVVAACRACNNRKNNTLAEAFIRQLYRDGFLDEQELADRVKSLEKLRAGELRPIFEDDGKGHDPSSLAS